MSETNESDIGTRHLNPQSFADLIFRLIEVEDTMLVGDETIDRRAPEQVASRFPEYGRVKLLLSKLSIRFGRFMLSLRKTPAMPET